MDRSIYNELLVTNSEKPTQTEPTPTQDLQPAVEAAT